MEKKDLRIVFMGTPEFAVPTLKALVENDYNVVGYVDKDNTNSHKGRDKKITNEETKDCFLHSFVFCLIVLFSD